MPASGISFTRGSNLAPGIDTWGERHREPGWMLIAFAQDPRTAECLGSFTMEGTTYLLMFQGIAWVDPKTWQIVRMRTGLLGSSDGADSTGKYRRSEFTEVVFGKTGRSLWLPHEVVVTTEWKARFFETATAIRATSSSRLKLTKNGSSLHRCRNHSPRFPPGLAARRRTVSRQAAPEGSYPARPAGISEGQLREGFYAGSVRPRIAGSAFQRGTGDGFSSIRTGGRVGG